MHSNNRFIKAHKCEGLGQHEQGKIRGSQLYDHRGPKIARTYWMPGRDLAA